MILRESLVYKPENTGHSEKCRHTKVWIHVCVHFSYFKRKTICCFLFSHSCVTSKPQRFFFYEVEGMRMREYGRTLFRNSV